MRFGVRIVINNSFFLKLLLECRMNLLLNATYVHWGILRGVLYKKILLLNICGASSTHLLHVLQSWNSFVRALNRNSFHILLAFLMLGWRKGCISFVEHTLKVELILCILIVWNWISNLLVLDMFQVWWGSREVGLIMDLLLIQLVLVGCLKDHLFLGGRIFKRLTLIQLLLKAHILTLLINLQLILMNLVFWGVRVNMRIMFTISSLMMRSVILRRRHLVLRLWFCIYVLILLS